MPIIYKKKHGYQLVIDNGKHIRIPIISNKSEESDFFATMPKTNRISYLQSRSRLSHDQLKQLITEMDLKEYVIELRNKTIEKLHAIGKVRHIPPTSL